MNPIKRIGFLIKGDYSDTEMYDFMDIVYYNGASYVAKKPTIGNAPVRKNEYWQIFAEGGALTGASDISDTTVAFQQAQERVNISTGESAKTLFGKIKKWFADLKGTAFSAPVTNLFATVTGNSLDATMGKKLKDLHDANKNEIDAVNASLSWKAFGQLSKDNPIIDFPNSFRELQFVFGIGNYRYVFGFCNMALNAALGRMLYVVNGEWWQNSRNNKVSATFIINPTNTFVNGCYFNDIESSDYIVWCYYR